MDRFSLGARRLLTGGLPLALGLLLATGCARDGRLTPRDQLILHSDFRPLTTAGKLLDQAPVVATPVATPRIEANPEQAEPWMLTLDEALTISMRNSDIVRAMDGGSVGATSSTRFDPVAAEARARAALATFDPSFSLGYYHNWIDQPSESLFGPGIPENTRRNEASFNASIIKPWITGGETRVGYNPPQGFLFFPGGGPGVFNPLQTANVEVLMRQPLLRGAGIETNRAPILVANVRADQSVWDLKRAVMASVRSVEEAYWDLHAGQVALGSFDEALPLAEEVVRIQQENFAAQRIIRADVAKSRGLLYQFRQQRLQSLSSLIERELRLRNLLGLEPGDGKRLVAVSLPGQAKVIVDPEGTVVTALSNRPDVVRQRLNVRIRELEMVVAKNGLRPQLDWNVLYRMNGLGQTLGSALDELADNKFTDWQTSMTFSVPLGRRAARAGVRAAGTMLAKEHAMLRQAVHAASFELGDIVRELHFLHRQYVEAEKRLEEANEWLEGARLRYQNPPPASDGQDWLLLALNDYYLAMRFKVDAATDASQLVARYNTQLARLEEAKGTLLASHNIHLLDDPCRQVQTVDLSPLRFETVEEAGQIILQEPEAIEPGRAIELNLPQFEPGLRDPALDLPRPGGGALPFP